MDLFIVNVLLLGYCSFLAFPHGAASSPVLGLPMSANTHAFGFGMPGVSAITVALVLGVIGVTGLIPLAYSAFCRWPARYRKMMAFASLIEVGQIVCIGILLQLRRAGNSGKSIHWVYACIWVWPIPITMVVYTFIGLRLYGIVRDSVIHKMRKMPWITIGITVTSIVAQGGVNLLSGIILGISSQGSGRRAARILMVIGGTTDAAVSILLLLILFQYLSWYHKLRAEQFNGSNHAENGEILRRAEQCAIATMTREALGIAVFQVARVTLLLIPSTLGGYFVLSCLTGKVYFLFFVRAPGLGSMKKPMPTAGQDREGARREAEMSVMNARKRNAERARLSISEMAYHDFLNQPFDGVTPPPPLATPESYGLGDYPLTGHDDARPPGTDPYMIDNDQQVSAAAELEPNSIDGERA